MPQLTVNDMMEAYAQDAVDYARSAHQITLDFSEDSIKDVEKILASLHDSLPKGMLGKLFKKGPTDEQIWQMAKVLGGYVGEVIRRKWGGEWNYENHMKQQGLITLHVGSTEIYPPVKAYKRITAGAPDSIWYYYQVMKRQFAEAEESVLPKTE